MNAAIYAALPSTVASSVRPPDSASTETLQSYGTPCVPLIGVQADQATLQNSSIAQFVAYNFNLITVSGMKWIDIHPTPTTYSFAQADWGVAFAQAHKMQVHGHNLCWNSPAVNPSWLGTVLTKANAADYLTQHITTVVSRYKGEIDSWDVVNEPITPWSTRSDLLYPGIWVNLLGPEYVDVAFHAAAAADPKALRVLNIYNVEQDNAASQLTRSKTLLFLSQLKSRGVPIQAVGIESHLDVRIPLNATILRDFFASIRNLGLEVLVTEFDVQESRATGTSLSWDQVVAEFYQDYLTYVLAGANPQRVIFWSILDRWASGIRIQGLLQSNLTPRLTFGAVASAFEEGCAK
jgi:endo-1,4-beta-xylanase